MKSRILKCTLLLALTSTCLFISACGAKKQAEIVSTLYNNTWVMDHYMDAVQDYDHVIYEQVYNDWGGRSIGPTEYRFRGIVYLTDEEAERLLNDYEWEEADAPEYEFDQVNTGFIGDGPWYSSRDFNKDNYPAVNVNYSVFDGEKLIFDFCQL